VGFSVLLFIAENFHKTLDIGLIYRYTYLYNHHYRRGLLCRTGATTE
jgi:hypothetical protein